MQSLRGVTGFYVLHCSITQLHEGRAYLLSIGVIPLPAQRRAATNYALVGRLVPGVGFEPLPPGSPVIGSQMHSAMKYAGWISGGTTTVCLEKSNSL